MKLHLIRHPKPKIQSGYCYGRSDLPLAEALDPHVARLRSILPCDYSIYSSPLSRALSLAQELGTPRLDARLQEMDFGDWELEPYEKFKAEIEAWAQDPLGYRIPGGESGLEVAARIWSFHEEIAQRHLHQHVVVVGHSGPFRLWLTQLLGLPLKQQHVFHFDFAKVTTVELHAHGGQLRALNR